MDNYEAPKARRPLPTPGAQAPAPRPETPRTSSSGVPGSSFYASSKPPPLPSRPKVHGSSHTSYVAPSKDSPHYRTPPSDFREPELVEETIQEEEESVPGLIPSDQNWRNTTPYEDPNSNWHLSNSAWNSSGANSSTSGDWANTVNGGGVDFDSIDYLGSGRLEQEYTIDGRSNQEEEHWWNPEERKRNQRPGPGILAPILAEELHDSNHSLFSVNISGIPSAAPSSSQKDLATPSILATSSTSDSPPPSESEVRTSVPHPNAYYCPKDNGWVILSWKSSSIPPPLARSYAVGLNPPLPDPVRRRRTSSCIEEASTVWKGQSNPSFPQI
jgi:ubiquitin carboxyl-terminal hydrolase 25/28